MQTNEKEKTVPIKTHATIHNVESKQLPDAWAKTLGIDVDKDDNYLVNVTLNVKPTRRKNASFEEVMKIVEHLQACIDPTKILTDDDMYDKYGLPK